MARNENSPFARLRIRRGQAAVASESEWRENARDMGLMLAGIYQDLRGDLRGGFGHFRRWLKGGWRRFTGPRD